MPDRSRIRRSALAGTWYPADPGQLRNAVELHLEQAELFHDIGTVIGLVSPHAGYMYSGSVMGYAYRQVLGLSFDTVVIIAPNHTDPRLSFSSVMCSGAYETPLGTVEIDEDTAAALAEYDSDSSIRASDLGHLDGYGGREEHSLEIQLPFLQAALGEFKLVPVLMGDQRQDFCEELGRAIAAAVSGKHALIVASSDMSHFHDSDTAHAFDSRVGEYIASYRPEELLSDGQVDQARVCGAGPIASMMIACRHLGATRATVLKQTNSGDVTGDRSNVVGYLAAAITIPVNEEQGEEAEAETVKVGSDLGLTDGEKEVLRSVVRETLATVVNGGRVPVFDDFSGNLGKKMGAFVTLHANGRLRGCIGMIVGEKPLITTVAEMTRAAALQDPRFPPVKPDELPSIDFEISVLTPIREITGLDEIVIGRDGLIITKGWNRGLLLPQVATDYGWDRETFLDQTCVKAGLPRGAWKDDDTTIEFFSAEVI